MIHLLTRNGFLFKDFICLSFKKCLMAGLMMWLQSLPVLAQTFSGQGGLPFPPSGTTGQVNSIASVSGIGTLGGCVKIDNVTVDLLHTWDGDIALFIIAPDGTWLELSSGNGSSGNNYQVTEFRDDAPINIIAGSPPYNGQFQAEGRQNTTLAPFYPNTNPPGTFNFDNTFTGVNADGEWTLFLNDFLGADVGFLNSWSITFTSGQNITVNAGNDVSTCSGGNPVILTANPNPSGTYTYNWSNNTGTPFTTVPPNSISTSPTATTIYTVTVTGGSANCTATDEVAINIVPAPDPGVVTMTADPLNLCAGGSTTLNFTVGQSNFWILNLEANSQTGITPFTVNINGTTGNYTANPTSTTTYTLLSVKDFATGCTYVLPNPIELTVEVGQFPTFGLQGVPPICEGQTIDLDDYVVLSNGTTVTYHSQNPPTPGNQISNMVSPVITTTYVLLFNRDGCTVPVNLVVEVIPAGNDPVFNDGSLCENTSINLTTLLNPSIPGTFNGPNVTGFNFFGAAPGTYSVEFVPASICYDAVTADITVDPEINVILDNASLCELDAPLDLATLEDPAYPLGTWTGPGIIGGGFFDPSLATGNVVLTFTPDYPCAPAKTTTIQVTAAGQPLLNSLSLCENADPVLLTSLQDPLFPNGTWSGDGVTGNSFDPAGLTGDVVLTFTPDDDCTLPATTTVTINPLETPDMDGEVVCELETAFDLTALEDPFYSGGNWFGTGVSGNQFNATSVSGFFVVLTYEGPGTCTVPVDVTIDLAIAITPNLSDAVWCEANGVFDLNTLEDPAFTTGVWSGPGVNGSLFNPLGFTGISTFTFISDDYCTQAVQTTIDVIPGVSPDLAFTTVCSSGPIYDLTLLEDPLYPNGSWSGTSVTNTSFDPSGLQGDYILTYQADGCAFTATTIITVEQVAIPLLSAETICENAGPYNLEFLLDPAYPTGSWSGPGVTNSFFDPSSLSGAVPLVFTSTASCTLPATTEIFVANAPEVSGLEITCLPGNEFYTVSFEITEGAAGTYLVNGQAVGNIFISNPLISESNFSFSVSDINDCSPVVLQGTKNCACATSAGSMANTSALTKKCADQLFTPAYNNDYTLESDTLLFVLHDNAGPSLGTISGISNTPVFGFPAGGELNKTYYVSAVAGNILGNFIDPNDPCLSVAVGAPVQFYEPGAGFTGPDKICISDSLRFQLNAEGVAPFTAIMDYRFDTGSVQDTLVFITSNTEVVFSPSKWNIPSGTVRVNLTQLTDANCTRFQNQAAQTVTVFPLRQSAVNTTLCKGDSLVINGTTYNEMKPAGVEIFPDLRDGYCDSVVTVKLNFISPSTYNLSAIQCKGTSVIVNGNTYDENRPVGLEILTGAAASGCDSIVTINLEFADKVSSRLDTTICKGTSVVINGNVYGENNAIDTLLFANGSAAGCDSLLYIAVGFTDLPEKNLAAMLCAGSQLIIAGKVFDESNPRDSVLIPGAPLSCDTLVFVDLSFSPESRSEVRQDICEGEFILINGKRYDKNNLSGTEILDNASLLGCDSIIDVRLTLLPSPVNVYNQTLCFGESITLNGQVYNAAQATGLQRLAGLAANGCDSLIDVQLTFLPQAVGNIDTTLCKGDSLVVNGMVLNEVTPTAAITLEKATSFGCDSSIVYRLTFFSPVVDTIRKNIAPNDSFVVDGIVFKSTYREGLVRYLPGNINGCDSFTYVVIRLVNNNFTLVNTKVINEKCPGQADGSIIVEEVAGCEDVVLSINGNNYGAVSLPFVVNGLSPGNYELILSSADGCYYQEIKTVKAAPQPKTFVLSKSGEFVFKDAETPLNLTIIPSPSSIEWHPDVWLSCSDCISPTVILPDTNQQYTLIMTDANGCSQEAGFDLRVKEKDITPIFPNVLSPDAGSSNNTWTINGGTRYAIVSVDIFDRWGSRVFTAKPVDNRVSWDGNLNGRGVTPGVYVYQVEIRLNDGRSRIIFGDITVL